MLGPRTKSGGHKPHLGGSCLSGCADCHVEDDGAPLDEFFKHLAGEVSCVVGKIVIEVDREASPTRTEIASLGASMSAQRFALSPERLWHACLVQLEGPMNVLAARLHPTTLYAHAAAAPNKAGPQRAAP